MHEEIWKDIQGYEEIYQASTHGRIKTKENKVTYSRLHGERHWQSRILKYRGHNPATGNRVCLYKNKICKEFLVARLIAFTFLGMPEDEAMTVNHIDGNRFNNNIENLEWLSLADNIRHAFNTGLMPTQQGIALIDNSKNKIRFKSLSKAGQHIGRTHGYISNCLNKNSKIRGNDGNEYSYELL